MRDGHSILLFPPLRSEGISMETTHKVPVRNILWVLAVIIASFVVVGLISFSTFDHPGYDREQAEHDQRTASELLAKPNDKTPYPGMLSANEKGAVKVIATYDDSRGSYTLKSPGSQTLCMVPLKAKFTQIGGVSRDGRNLIRFDGPTEHGSDQCEVGVVFLRNALGLGGTAGITPNGK